MTVSKLGCHCNDFTCPETPVHFYVLDRGKAAEMMPGFNPKNDLYATCIYHAPDDEFMFVYQRLTEGEFKWCRRTGCIPEIVEE